MKTTLIVLSLLISASIMLLFIFGMLSKSGKAPGLIAGRLSGCPDKPNCICSEQQHDVRHYIAPLTLSPENATNALPLLKKIISDMGGTIREESDTYLAATFSSAMFGFVDDLEIRVDSSQKVIHIRSASRVGYSDAGVNKKRAEQLKALYKRKVSGNSQSLNTTP